MSFKEIIGQESAVLFLKNAFRQGRLAHAYIFVGPDGIGKMRTALNFAKLLVCEDPRDSEPCDACASCAKAGSSNHPDIQHVAPDGSFIRIDAIREACRRLHLRSFEVSRKVLLIHGGEYLNEESSNALLKTLEEPSPDTVIVLVASSLKSVAPTILSRCQRIVFSLLPPDVIEGILRDRFHIRGDEALYLAGASAGSLGEALRYHEDKLFERKNALIRNALDRDVPVDSFLKMTGQDRTERLKSVAEALEVLSFWFRDLLVARITGDTGHAINVDIKEEIARDARQFTLEEIEDRINAIADASRDLERNANIRIAVARLRSELWK